VRGGILPFVLRLYISVPLQQKTANFKVASVMQWSGLTEENQNNQLAQTELQFIKTIGVQLLFVLRMNAGRICSHVVLNKSTFATPRCSKDVAFACNAGGGSLQSCVRDVRSGASSEDPCILHPHTWQHKHAPS
jgi:hypothetical protein